MKLLTKAIEQKLLNSPITTEESKRIPVIVKFFNPTGAGTWYVTEAQKLETTDPPQAEKLYRLALQKDRNQEAGILGLARLLIKQNKDSEASELLDRVGPGSEQGAEAERLSAIL